MNQLRWERLEWDDRFILIGNVILAIGTMCISIGTTLQLARDHSGSSGILSSGSRYKGFREFEGFTDASF